MEMLFKIFQKWNFMILTLNEQPSEKKNIMYTFNKGSNTASKIFIENFEWRSHRIIQHGKRHPGILLCQISSKFSAASRRLRKCWLSLQTLFVSTIHSLYMVQSTIRTSRTVIEEMDVAFFLKEPDLLKFQLEFFNFIKVPLTS